MLRQKSYRVGDLVHVRHVHDGYRLPHGLPEGAEVRVVAFDIGTRAVEYNGRRFDVANACIDSGWLLYGKPYTLEI